MVQRRLQTQQRVGVTLLEVIISIVVIAILVELGIVFSQRSRESARTNQCDMNLERLGRAVLLHHEKQGHYPTDGWGWMWLPDPDRGWGSDQPGSWAFCVLPYLEGSQSLAVSKGLKGQAKAEAIANLCSTPIATFACTARRQPQTLPVKVKLVTNDSFKIAVRQAAKSDYAINTGDYAGGEPIRQEITMIPKTIAEANDPSFQWYDTSQYTGISFGRSEVRSSELKKGTSKVYMIGEKVVKPEGYLTGADKSDNASMFCGFKMDNGRAASGGPQQDEKKTHDTVFGSAHADHWLAVFCDGSVHRMAYNINHTLHKQLANRTDSTGITTKFDLD
jgi:type II secretory pathway pseudopilin PulG